MRSPTVLFALAASLALAQAPAPVKIPGMPGVVIVPPATPPPPGPTTWPSDAECQALPSLKGPWAFGPGEVLEYDLDALGARAGTMVMRTLPTKDGAIPLEVTAQTNTFFSKVRRVKGVGTSFMNSKTLKPVRYLEDSTENEVHRVADVTFRAKDKNVHLSSNINGQLQDYDFSYAKDGLDVAGAIFYLRQMPLKDKATLCFDAYGIRRMWRVWGTVVGREHISLPVGEFDAWHIKGEAVWVPNGLMRREIHVWITDDARRLPLAALGSIDLGTVRATLKAFQRPGDKSGKAENKGNLTW